MILRLSFLVELEFANVGFRGEGKTGVPGEKPVGAKERTNNKHNLHMAWKPGFEPGPPLTTEPSIAIKYEKNNNRNVRPNYLELYRRNRLRQNAGEE